MPPARVLPLIIGIVVCVAGCSEAQRAFEQVQLCVGDEHGVAKLKNVMEAVARSENLQFIDNSMLQARSLKEIGADKALKSDLSQTIDLHIEGKGGLGASAGNLGLPPHQVGLGFTAGSDAAKARRLAINLTSSLFQHWSVQRVPTSQGILPSGA